MNSRSQEEARHIGGPSCRIAASQPDLHEPDAGRLVELRACDLPVPIHEITTLAPSRGVRPRGSGRMTHQARSAAASPRRFDSGVAACGSIQPRCAMRRICGNCQPPAMSRSRHHGISAQRAKRKAPGLTRRRDESGARIGQSRDCLALSATFSSPDDTCHDVPPSPNDAFGHGLSVSLPPASASHGRVGPRCEAGRARVTRGPLAADRARAPSRSRRAAAHRAGTRGAADTRLAGRPEKASWQ